MSDVVDVANKVEGFIETYRLHFGTFLLCVEFSLSGGVTSDGQLLNN